MVGFHFARRLKVPHSAIFSILYWKLEKLQELRPHNEGPTFLLLLPTFSQIVPYGLMIAAL